MAKARSAGYCVMKNVGTLHPMLPENLRNNSTHLDAVCRFARSKDVAEASAVEMYEREHHQLSADAKVGNFVGLLAEKRVKAVIVKLKGPRVDHR